MARNKRQQRVASGWLARPTQALGHTASPRTRYVSGHYDDPGLIPVRSPLIRTVLVDPAPPQPKPRRGSRQSPAVSVRATGRSSQKAVRSPFLNATMVTPQLADRAILCATRTIRREVLFANRQTGKGSRSPRKPKSKVRC